MGTCTSTHNHASTNVHDSAAFTNLSGRAAQPPPSAPPPAPAPVQRPPIDLNLYPSLYAKPTPDSRVQTAECHQPLHPGRRLTQLELDQLLTRLFNEFIQHRYPAKIMDPDQSESKSEGQPPGPREYSTKKLVGFIRPLELYGHYWNGQISVWTRAANKKICYVLSPTETYPFSYLLAILDIQSPSFTTFGPPPPKRRPPNSKRHVQTRPAFLRLESELKEERERRTRTSMMRELVRSTLPARVEEGEEGVQ